MEANEIVIREVFATVPPTVEYTLTEKVKITSKYIFIIRLGSRICCLKFFVTLVWLYYRYLYIYETNLVYTPIG